MDPDNPFYIYAIAMEYKSSDAKKARKLLQELQEKHPDYLPLYYQLAVLYESEEDIDNALDTLKHGMNLAQTQANDLTYRELKSFKEELEFD
jgi:Tfp pilus assembly protein PilF